MSIQTCRQCSNNFEVLTRGRPPLLCYECKELSHTDNNAGNLNKNIKEPIEAVEVLNLNNDPKQSSGRFKNEDAGLGSFAKSRLGKTSHLNDELNKSITGLTPNKILQVIGEDEDVRRCVIDKFKLLGGSLDRWTIVDRLKMCEALTAGEDALELEYPRMNDRRRNLRNIRRKLEYSCG